MLQIPSHMLHIGGDVFVKQTKKLPLNCTELLARSTMVFVLNYFQPTGTYLTGNLPPKLHIESYSGSYWLVWLLHEAGI